jgi:arginyl-tRNA synthetase
MELTKKLGRAAATLDMIEVKHSSVLRLTSNPKQAFILYNSARIETLVSNFEEMVESNYYPVLPQINDVNLELLTETLEWVLLKHLLTFPDIIEKSLENIEHGQIALHNLYKYLIAFVTKFSEYYSKKKILLENRPHLVPLVHAKIHLLKAIQKILNLTLNLFEIEPVKFM